jgi:nucleoside-diphosphate-sugar epimerase
MRAFVTGGTGFIGGQLVAKLRERGDEVVALVRAPDRAGALRALGCELVQGDLASVPAMQAGMEGCDIVFHVAAVYAIGIPESRRREMLQANIDGTAAVLDAAIAAGVSRIVYVSTVNVFGNTHGKVVDESYHRNLNEGFLSTYDEAKYRAHEVALERIRSGAPIVIVQPAGVYGPHDHSEVGNTINQVRRGLLPLIPFPSMGICLVHVDDVADGLILAGDKGKVGESYLLAGEQATMKSLVQTTARIAGRRVPKWPMPTKLLKLVAPIGPLVGPIFGFNPNMRELITVSDGVTYWATDARARTELGFAPRTLEQGLRDTLAHRH